MRFVFLLPKSPTMHRIARISAFFTLVLLPLAFRNGFFDINRIKVELTLIAVPALAIFAILDGAMRRRIEEKTVISRECRGILAALTAFALACAVSSGMQDFSEETLLGSDGRYCGLLFLLCCCIAFAMISLGAVDGRLEAAAASMTAAAIAALGILNVGGVDPLRFYDDIKESQISLFASTIGNVDFFGAYLSMIFPLAAAKAVLAENRREILFFASAAALIVCGIAASRSDSAYFALQLACLMLAAQSGDQLDALQRINLLWSFSFSALPMMRLLLERGRWGIPYTGALALLCDTGITWGLSGSFLLAALACRRAMQRGGKAPGKRVLIGAAVLMICVLIIVLLALIVYFTAFKAQTELGAAASILRFDDAWGTRRGFVYRCSVEAFSDFTLREKLFGGGVDCVKRILTPYFDDEHMLRFGVFNDAHCQLLQFLLTTGITGASAFLAVYALVLRACFRAAENDPLICGAFASLCGYAVIALLGVTQPMIIMTYFSISALAVSRLNHLKRRETHEP